MRRTHRDRAGSARRRTAPWGTIAKVLVPIVVAAGLVAVAAPASASTSAMVTDPGCNSHALVRDDDQSTGQISLPFRLNLYGKAYSSLYVNNNGNVTFQAPMSTYTPFTIDAHTPPMIAPFFADVDTRNDLSQQTTYGRINYDGHTAFCVNWSHVGYFSEHVDKANTFQLILEQLGTQGDFNIVFNYGSIKWETGDGSGGAGGMGGTPAGAGFSNGDGNPAHFAQLAGSLRSGAFVDGGSAALATHSNTLPAVPGRYVYKIASGTAVAATNRCTPYYYISLVGSGELSSHYPNNEYSTKASAIAGLDPTQETGIVYDALAGNYPSAATNVTVHQVPYQAAPLSILLRQWWRLNLLTEDLPLYINSVFDGVNKTMSYISKVHWECQEQHVSPKFILVGYSQGALAIHLLLQEEAGRDQGASFAKSIASVGLIADPAAIAGRQDVRNWGTAPESLSFGICQQAKVLTTTDQCGTKIQDMPTAFHSLTEEVCDFNDPICSASGVALDRHLPPGLNLYVDIQVHSQYRTTRAAKLKNLGAWLASSLH